MLLSQVQETLFFNHLISTILISSKDHGPPQGSKTFLSVSVQPVFLRGSKNGSIENTKGKILTVSDREAARPRLVHSNSATTRDRNVVAMAAAASCEAQRKRLSPVVIQTLPLQSMDGWMNNLYMDEHTRAGRAGQGREEGIVTGINDDLSYLT